MKLRFSLKGKRQTDSRYAVVKAGLPEAQWQLYTALLSASLDESFYQLAVENGSSVGGGVSVGGGSSVSGGVSARGSVSSAGGNGSTAGDNLASLRERIRDNDPVFVAKLAVYLREKMNYRHLSLLVTAELAAFHGDSEWIASLIARVLPQAGEIPEWMGYYTRANAAAAALKANVLGTGSRKTNFRMANILLAGTPRLGTARSGSPRLGASGSGTVRLGKAVQRGLTLVCNRLDEYQFTRYTREDQLKWKNALLLIRPKAKDKVQRLLFGKILKGALPARTTWERELHMVQEQKYDSLELQQATLRDKWKEGISSFRIGYAALVDHLPEILAAGVSGKVLKRTAEYLCNAAAIAGSGISPYRFPEVYRKLQSMGQGGAPMLLDALEKAIRHSARNLAGFEEKSRSVIAMDVSNSMKHPVREGSDMQRFDIAPLLAMLLRSRGKQVTTGIIGNTWKSLDLPAQGLGHVGRSLELTDQGILAGMEPFRRREGEVGYAINGHLVIQDLLRKGQIVDKVMIFTDCRLWDNRVFHQPAGTDLSRVWKSYRQIAPEATLYLFDMAGYGNKPLEVLKDGVFLVSGWNERIFDVLGPLGKQEHTLSAINQTEL